MITYERKLWTESYRLIVAAGMMALAGTLAGCQSQEVVNEEPILELLIRPTSISDRGEEADIQVTTLDEFDRPGRGDVVLEATHGQFSNGERTITVTLDSSGTAWAVYHCNVFEDEECFGSISVSASWQNPGSALATTDKKITIEGCGRPNAGNPTIVRKCAPAAATECSGEIDTFLTGASVSASRLNGASGNGFDDDCDGLVDEGCSCPGNGQTKECYLVPATQVAADTGLPVNWCATNSKGSVDCAGEQQTVWTGVCRGAQPPAENDSCSEGDFNCDGLQSNNPLSGCRCASAVKCPTDPIVKAPFPDPRNLAPIEGFQWITDASKRALATNWTWTVVGGDCDNVLPFPTFGLFKGKDTTLTGARIGTRKPVRYDTAKSPPRYAEQAQSKLAALQALTGTGLAGGVVYPAFGLSGDYIVQGEFDLNGTHFVCTQKVQVRAPGLRAEMCWDSVGFDDVDLHFARLQESQCTSNVWDETCNDQDCFWANENPNWDYVTSPDSACRGWSSRRVGACTNPRLDRDVVRCDRNNSDPNNANFCGPENINIDNPRNGDRFVVGVNYFGSRTNPPLAHPHVNIYCNGERVLSAGYNPVTGQLNYPALLTAGGDTGGDYWTVATVQTTVTGGNLVGCAVETIPSRYADPTRDGPPSATGGADFCVDSTRNATPAPNTFNYVSHQFVDANSSQGLAEGAIPQTREQWCKH
ncbi:hypothetical protein [Hyalangium sp.]|uniref:hypothetical protein n=1 Tax=Hyalangium sp. TaxID=2028555 RepID=UPI002D2D9339|nr:hypothetical protein [Hyalangium sp.]HYI00431.1 hypothetical protein [Hyalangium sp.]